MAKKNSCVDATLSIWNMIKFLFVVGIYKTRVLPSVHLDQFHVPTINSTGNLNRTIYINLKLKNKNHVTGIYYDDPVYLNLTFFPKDQNTSISLGEYGMHGFYQGKGKGKRVMGPLLTRGIPRTTDGGFQGTQPVGIFRVDFFAKVRHKVSGFNQRHTMILSANVEFNGTNSDKFEKKANILLKSSAWIHEQPLITMILMSIMLTIFIC